MSIRHRRSLSTLDGQVGSINIMPVNMAANRMTLGVFSCVPNTEAEAGEAGSDSTVFKGKTSHRVWKF